MGLFNGIFFGIFQVNQIGGNLISGFVLNAGTDTLNLLIYIFLGLCGLSFLIMTFLPNEFAAEPQEQQSVLKKVFRAVLLFKDPKLLLLMTVFLYSGLEQSFNAGIFTGELITPTVGQSQIGFVMAVFGAFNVLGSFAMGRVADRFGGWPLVIVGFSMNVIFLVSTWIIFYLKALPWISVHEWYLYLAAALLAIGDAAWNTFPNTILGVYWPDNAEAAFANLKFWQSVGAVLPFAFGKYILIETKLEIMFGILVAGVGCLLVLQFFVASLSPPKKVDVIN